MNPQTGILNRPTEHALLAGLAFTRPEPIANRETLELLRDVVRRELQSDIDELSSTSDKTVPSSETGELGALDNFNRAHLTITVGFSSTAIAALGCDPAQAPADLVALPWADFKDTPAIAASGDLILQICADDPYVVEHVLRRIEHTLADRLRTVWSALGHQRFSSRHGRTSAEEGRALIGFHDGLVNLDPAHNEDDAALVFVDPAKVSEYPVTPSEGQQPAPVAGQSGYGGGAAGPIFPPMRPAPASEPQWTKGGTYMTVRVSVTDTPSWDATALGAQEKAVGRFKFSGATLDHADDPSQIREEPNFANDPSGQVTPFTAHIRKANPRSGPDDVKRRIFRRGYPLIAAGTDGQLQRGLAFVCFSRTTSTQPEFIFKAWLRNSDFPVPGAGVDALLAFDKTVLAGGYFFVPPLKHRTQPWSWDLPPAAA